MAKLSANELSILSAAKNGLEKFRRGWSHSYTGPHFWPDAAVQSLMRHGFLSGSNGSRSSHVYTTKPGIKALDETRAVTEGHFAAMRQLEERRYPN